MNSLDHIKQLMSVIENHQQGVAEGSKGAVGKLVGESRVTKRLAEFSPTGSDDGNDDFNFSEDMLKRLAAQWWQGDKDDKETLERLLMLHGWEIGQDEAHDDEPGVFVGQDGQAEFGWPVSELKQGVAEDSGQPLSVEQLATISDEALDRAYGYGRSTPGDSFGWQANLMSAAYAKELIDKGVTDIEKISDAVHRGWNVTAKKFVQNPDQFSDTEQLRRAGKLEAKVQQRDKLSNINYAQLDDEEKEKDRVVARALLQAIQGKQDVAEAVHSILDIISPKELEELKGYVSGDRDDFYGSEVFNTLYDYYLERGMPYGTAKGRTGDPDRWILDRVEQDYSSELSESESSHDDQHLKRRFPGFEDGGSNYMLRYEDESGAEHLVPFALSADGYPTVNDFVADFQYDHPSALVLGVEPESPDAAASNNKLSEDHTMNDMRKLITVCESAMNYDLAEETDDIMAPHTEDSGRFVTKRVVGHEDREARMMQRELLKIADYAQELCDMLEHLQDADFPHWWQAKLVKAGDYMSTIKHFLDGEQRLGAREPLDHEISVMPIADDMLALDEDQDSDEDHAEMGPDGKPFDPTRLYRWGKKFWEDQESQVYDRLVDLYGQNRVRKITHPVSGGKQIDLLTNHYDDDFIADLHRDGYDWTIPRSAEKAKIRGFDAYLGTDGKFYSLEGQGIPYEMPKDEW